jgi:xylulokinase
VDADGSQVPYDVINEEVAKRKAAEDGLFFYPFSGRSTLGKGFSKASFVGLDLSHDRFDIARAIMEGVAFQIVWMMEAFKTKPSQEGLKLAGGASKSTLWCQMVADIANLPVRIPEVADLACVGAAILAGVGSGIYRDAEEGYKCLAVRERVLQPNPERAAMYAKLFEEYKHHAGVLGAVYGL